LREIYLDSPNLGVIEKNYLNRCIDSNYVSTVGPFVSEFEEKFASYLGVRKAVSVQSGTAAIYMALYELGIGPGDEVIVPVLTFIATVNPVMHLGATPVFVDVDPVTWNMDPEEVEKAITSKTKAILPVHLYGNPCNMDDLLDISRRYGIPIVEDATESLGAYYKDKMTGTFGEFGCFSFNGNKVITTGGGGMIVTEDERKASHIKYLINQARDSDREFYHSEVGFNYRMTNLEASLGLAQLERLSDFLVKKKGFNKIYREILSEDPDIEFQEQYEGAFSSWWMNSMKAEYIRGKVALVQDKLRLNGIPTRRIFMPIVEFPPYKKFKKGDYKNAYDIYETGLNLPSSTLNEIEQVEDAARIILEVLRNEK